MIIIMTLTTNNMQQFLDLIEGLLITVEDSKSFVSEHIDDMLPKTAFSISAGDVRDILRDAKMGKSAGLDSLAAEYFVILKAVLPYTYLYCLPVC